MQEPYETARRQYRTIQNEAEDERRRRRAARYRSHMRQEHGEADEAIEIVDDVLSGWNGETADREVCRLLLEKGTALKKRGEADAAERLFDDALAMARTIGDDELVGRALHHLGRHALGQGGRSEETEALIQRAIRTLEGTDERRLRANACNNLGIVKVRNGDVAAGKEALERTLDIQLEIGDEVAANSTRENLGILYLREGNLERAEAIHREALESARLLGDKEELALIHENLGDTYERAGDLADARRHFERSVEIYRSLDNEPDRLHAEASLAYDRHLQGHLEEALERAERAAETAADVSPYLHGFALVILGAIRKEAGDIEGAIEAHERNAALVEDMDVTERTVDSQRWLGLSYLAADRIAAAGRTLQSAREAVSEMDDRWRTLYVTRAHGRCKLRHGDLEGARSDLESALQTARDLGGRLDEARSLYALGKLHGRRNDDDRAAERFTEARSIAEAVGATPLERKCRRALSERS